MLFGGLITIPFWVYDHMPAAVIDVMLADLPRVEYFDPDKVTEEDIQKAEEKSKRIAERTKARGLGVKLSNMVGPQDRNAFLARAIK